MFGSNADNAHRGQRTIRTQGCSRRRSHTSPCLRRSQGISNREHVDVTTYACGEEEWLELVNLSAQVEG